MMAAIGTGNVEEGIFTLAWVPQGQFLLTAQDRFSTRREKLLLVTVPAAGCRWFAP